MAGQGLEIIAGAAMHIRSILFPVFPPILVTAALAGCAVGPDAIDDD
jgi:hypothetical protein